MTINEAFIALPATDPFLDPSGQKKGKDELIQNKRRWGKDELQDRYFFNSKGLSLVMGLLCLE